MNRRGFLKFTGSIFLFTATKPIWGSNREIFQPNKKVWMEKGILHIDTDVLVKESGFYDERTGEFLFKKVETCSGMIIKGDMTFDCGTTAIINYGDITIDNHFNNPNFDINYSQK